MIRSLSIVGVLAFALPAAAQRAGLESTPEQCRDHVDNDGDGRIDCQDPKCLSLGVCAPLPILEVGGEERLSPKAQIAAGAVLLLIGPLIGGASAPVFTDAAAQSATSKKALEYTVGGIMCAAGIALAITGGTTLKKGLRRHREEKEMGIALAPTRLDFRLRF